MVGVQGCGLCVVGGWHEVCGGSFARNGGRLEHACFLHAPWCSSMASRHLPKQRNGVFLWLNQCTFRFGCTI